MTKKQEKQFELEWLMYNLQDIINHGKRDQYGVTIDHVFITDGMIQTIKYICKEYDCKLTIED